MKINTVKIKNFKMFKERVFQLDNFSILVGENGAGKSTLLQAINLALNGYYNGKGIIGNISQDIFNKESVNEYINSLKENDPIELPKIEIEITFDDYPEFEGDNNIKKGKADGFTFRICFDERNNDSYSLMLKNNEIKNSLPIEFYKCEWNTFSRENYSNSKVIKFKSTIIDSDNFRENSFYSTKLIKQYFDDNERIVMSQKHRNICEQLVDLEPIKDVNNKITSNKFMKDKKVSIGITSSSQTTWENFITAKKDEIPFDEIGKGNQCLIKSFLSFENESLKKKGIILIEEPENHLSFSNLNILLEYISTKLSEYQVIISTHNSYVINKLGLNNLILFSKDAYIKLNELDETTTKYFEKVSGFDTLRYILCTKAILVEGDSDDLIIQKAYKLKHDKLPIENGIDIICTGLSYKRFLEIGKKINIKTVVVTDNDGNDKKYMEDKFIEYNNCKNIKLCYSKEVNKHDDFGVSKDVIHNVNTLEPELLKANSLTLINRVLGTDYQDNESLLKYMIGNKTDVAWKIFITKESINFPDYINLAVEDE